MDERANAEWVASAGPAPGVAARSSKSASKRAGTIGARSESRAGHSRSQKLRRVDTCHLLRILKNVISTDLPGLALKLRCFSSCAYFCTLLPQTRCQPANLKPSKPQSFKLSEFQGFKPSCIQVSNLQSSNLEIKSLHTTQRTKMPQAYKPKINKPSTSIKNSYFWFLVFGFMQQEKRVGTFKLLRSFETRRVEFKSGTL